MTDDHETRLLVSETYDSYEINYEYDSTGNLILATGTNSDGIFQTESYTYNSDNLLQHYERHATDTNQTTFLAAQEDYDASGNLVSSIEYDSSGNPTIEYSYQYDAENREIQSIRITYESGIEHSRRTTTTTYDGNKSTSTVTSTDGTTIFTIISEYDASGNMISRSHYDADNNLEFTLLSNYSNTGQCISDELTYSKDYANSYDCPDRQVINYDPATGLQLSSYEYVDDEKTLYSLYEYSDTGHLLSITSYSKDDNFSPSSDISYSVSYEYDDSGRIAVESLFEGDALYCAYTYSYVSLVE
jgi:hypothetical protein